jgi:hypothetical protein
LVTGLPEDVQRCAEGRFMRMQFPAAESGTKASVAFQF